MGSELNEAPGLFEAKSVILNQYRGCHAERLRLDACPRYPGSCNRTNESTRPAETGAGSRVPRDWGGLGRLISCKGSRRESTAGRNLVPDKVKGSVGGASGGGKLGKDG